MGLEIPVTDLGEAGHLDVLDRLVDIDGKFVVDVGSGDGAFTQALAERGARVLAIEPDERHVPPDLPAALTDRITFKCAGGEAIPLADGEADGVIFNRSLHHVPGHLMDQALKEARRVLNPRDGFLYVAEPDMAGGWSQLLKPFHDETEVRAQALEALDRASSSLFADVHEYWYSFSVRFDDFQAFATHPLMTILNVAPEDLDTHAVRSVFEGGRADDGYAFSQAMRLRVFRGAA